MTIQFRSKFLPISGIILLALLAGFNTKAQQVTLVAETYLKDTTAFKACHASTLVRLPDGDILTAWFGGKFEGSPDVSIWLARRNGNIWSAPKKIADGIGADGKQLACWNPVLFKAKNGRLYLHYKVGPNPREWKALYKWSANNGKSWSKAIALPDGYLGPIKNKPVQLTSGDILYPSSTESLDEKQWRIHLEKTDAQLKHWEQIAIDCDTFQTIQPSILVYPNHRLQLLARSKQNVIVQSWSADGGKLWSKVSAMQLPNPNSGSDAVNLKGVQYLVYNPLKAGKDWWEGRSVLKLAMSRDGISWTDIYPFENRPKGEYSYPAIIADSNGHLYVTYTADRKSIRFVELAVK
jgi:predicted neuraminidase